MGEISLLIDDPIVIINPAVFFFHPDHLGSSTMISDGSGYAYQLFLNLPFGETMAEQRLSGTLDNMYKFNGKELDSETGLYYYGARYYDPRTSIFLSVDPLTESTMTPYQYTYQNPVRYIDPTGMSGEDWIKRGKQFFYDSEIKTQDQAVAKYGKNAVHFGEGSSLYSTTNGVANGDYSYIFHANGTVTDINGDTIDNTQTITTKGGSTIFANCPDCLNPGTLYQNILGMTYPGGNNPLTYRGDYSYEYKPSFLSEYPAIGHDRRYDNLGVKGASGLFMDTRTIGADWKFVAEELKISLNPFNGASHTDRQLSGALGIGLGAAALPKTIFKLSTPKGVNDIIKNYIKSNSGVTNTPSR
jgi:RHS repeat-associated protein